MMRPLCSPALRLLLPVLAFLPGLFAGCTSYNPFLNPPAQPLPKGKGEVAASLGGLPPVNGGSNFADLGTEGLVRYAFSNRLTLGARMWTADMNWTDGLDLSGFSFDGFYLLSGDSGSTRIAIAPRVHFLTSGETIAGRGLSVDALAWLPPRWILKPFIAFGAGIGEDLADDAVNPALYTMMFRAGASTRLFDTFDVSVEVASFGEFDHDFGYDRWITVPNVSLRWDF